MRSKYLSVIILVVCVAFIGNCVSTTFPEANVPNDNEIAFINMLHELGLNWKISASQRLLPDPVPQHDQRTYITTCPSSLISSFIVIRNGLGSIFGERHIYISLQPYRQGTDDEFEYLQQNGLMSDNDWLLFWELAGKILDKEDCVSILANRSLGYLDDFQFRYNTERSVTIMEGNKEDIDYRVILTWHPFLERYAQYEIMLTVGLTEFYREYRKRLEWVRW